MKRGSGETYVRSQSLSSAESAVKSIPTSVPCRAKKDSNISSPGRIRLVKCPTPGPTKTIKSPPLPCLSLPPPPRCRLYIDRCIRTYFVYFHTFSYKFKVQRTLTAFGPPLENTRTSQQPIKETNKHTQRTVDRNRHNHPFL